jgi:hypothetical protein
MSQQLNAIFDGIERIHIVANSLDDLASAFDATGNSHVANRLYLQARRARDAVILIQDGYTGEVSGMARDAEKIGVAIMKAAVTGVAELE